jgi:hypothetical protein
MKKKTSFFLFLLLLGLYIFLFPFPLSKETYLLPVWVKDVSHSETSPGDSQSSPIPFRLGDTFGFVSEKGALSLSEAVLYDVSFDENFSSGGGFVSFSSVSDNLVFRDRKGDFLFTIETFGYPILMNGRIFVISTDRQTLAEYDDTGAVLWRKSYTSIITAAHATSLGNSDPLIVVGLLNGRTEVLSRSGSWFSPPSRRGPGSRLPTAAEYRRTARISRFQAALIPACFPCTNARADSLSSSLARPWEIPHANLPGYGSLMTLGAFLWQGTGFPNLRSQGYRGGP